MKLIPIPSRLRCTINTPTLAGSARRWPALAPRWPDDHHRGFDIDQRLKEIGYRVEENNEAILPDAAVPDAIMDPNCTVFHVESVEMKSHQRVHAEWSAFYKPEEGQFYIAAPVAISASGKQSLVSLLELAESLECTTAWMYVDRQRPDFVSVVSTFKYLGFQLSQQTVKDPKANKMYALLRYELD